MRKPHDFQKKTPALNEKTSSLTEKTQVMLGSISAVTERSNELKQTITYPK